MRNANCPFAKWKDTSSRAGSGREYSLVGGAPWGHLGPLSSLSGTAIKAGSALFGWVWTYVVVGSALVVPVWLLYEVIVYLRRN